ncbi:MAG: transglycosylase domain-containing protein [Pseudolysinimonas sp.]|uniref:transglycosylase domain-containing protein n=1 Tax=Pseudolysinimonas sp. TaxID=2680009 RepID=UPI00326582EF
MPAQKSTATSLFFGVLGTLGFSALAGLLVTVLVAPAIAVSGVAANNTVGIFNSLPEYIKLDSGSQQNTIAVVDPAHPDLTDPEHFRDVAVIYKQNREEIPLDQISPYLQCAAIAGEDRRFYSHGGVDVPSLIRAAVGQVTHSGDSGASTLSMQTVRNILQQQALNDPTMSEDAKKAEIAKSLAPTLDRKLKEMKLAIGLEKNYSKDEILQGYLNIAGFGGNTYGVQAAAQQYFSKSAADLTIAEAASLIAIVQYPNLRDLSDPSHYAANTERRDVILTAMAQWGTTGDTGCITKAERDEAIATPVDTAFVVPAPPSVGCTNADPGYGFVCDYAKRVVPQLAALGNTPAERSAAWDRGGYKLVLTINPTLQDAAVSTASEWAPKDEDRFSLGAAAVSVEVGTGNILVMALNKDFNESLNPPTTSTAVNYAVDFAHGGSQGFQPGSTYKPYVLLAFLAAGHGLGEAFNAGILETNQAEYGDSCAPETFDGKVIGPPWGGKYTFHNDANEMGSFTVTRGTAGSVNSVFLQMAKEIDQCDIRKVAESLGVHNANGTDELSTRPSCAIGGCENNLAPLTQAAGFAAIAGGGVYCAPIMIAQVIVVQTGDPLPGESPNCAQSAMVSPSVANTAAYAMEGVMNGGTGSVSNPRDGTPYIGKTGTTDKSVHTWMVGSSTRVATAVWVGNITGNQALRNIKVLGQQAGTLRHRIFKPIAIEIDKIYPGGAFPAPDPALLIGNPIEVPNVVGLTPEAAKESIETVSELVYEDGGTVDSDLPLGVVASTDPAVGSSVPRGTTIRVYTSNHLAVPVPNVVGMQHAAAKTNLEAAHYTVTQICISDADLGGNPAPPPGQVVSQDPAAGTFRNPATTTVTIKWYQPVICTP